MVEIYGSEVIWYKVLFNNNFINQNTIPFHKSFPLMWCMRHRNRKSYLFKRNEINKL